MKDIDKIRNIIENELNENIRKIECLEDKINIIKENTFNQKFVTGIPFGLISLIIIIINISILDFNLVPIELIQPLSICIPTLMGFIGQQIVYRKKQCKQKLRKVSNAKSNKDLLSEITKYEIEKEKLINKNKILNKVCTDLESDKYPFNIYYEKYSIAEKENCQTQEDLFQKINNILIEDEEKLDKLSIKKFLQKKFRNARFRLSISDYLFSYGMIGFALPFMIYNLVGLELILNDLQLHTSFLEIISPGIIGFVVATTYGLNNRKNSISTFNSFNEKLGEDKLSLIETEDEEKKLGFELYKIMQNISKTKLYLESIKIKQEKEKMILEQNNQAETQLHKEVLYDSTNKKSDIHYEEQEMDEIKENNNISIETSEKRMKFVKNTHNNK